MPTAPTSARHFTSTEQSASKSIASASQTVQDNLKDGEIKNISKEKEDRGEDSSLRPAPDFEYHQR